MSSLSVSLQRSRPSGSLPRARVAMLTAAVAMLIAAVVAVAFASLSAERATVAAITGSVLVVLSVIDVRRSVIPNRIVLPATAVVLSAQLALFPAEVFEDVLVALVAAFALALPSLAGRSWVGMGDVKLVLLIGVAAGWGVIGAVLIAFVSVLPVALLLMLRGGLAARKTMLPFGPFLTLGALAVLVGPSLAGLS